MIPVVHGERLAGETAPAAGRAAHFYIGQEMHFNREHACSFTALAAPARDIE